MAIYREDAVSEDKTSVNDQLSAFTESTQLPPEVNEVIANSIIAGSRGEVRGLAIGDRAPDFTLLNNAGEAVNLYRRLEKTPVALCFLRGEWCPYCMIEVRLLKQAARRIGDGGASLIFVHPQRVDVSKRLAEPRAEGVEVCHDELQNVISAYQVKFDVDARLIKVYREVFGIDLAQLNADGQLHLPVPAAFIVDRDRIIKGRQFSHDFRVRVEPSYIVDVLAALPQVSPEFELRRDA
jgi:peroxiredoxin